MALAVDMILIVNAPNQSVFTIGIFLAVVQMVLWGKLMSEIKE